MNRVILADKRIRKNNHGETLVEILVAFVVLTIVLAMFAGAISSASAAGNNSISKRRGSDKEYEELHQVLLNEEFSGAPGSSSTGTKKESDLTGGDDSPVYNLTAYKYISGDTVYWVYRDAHK